MEKELREELKGTVKNNNRIPDLHRAQRKMKDSINQQKLENPLKKSISKKKNMITEKRQNSLFWKIPHHQLTKDDLQYELNDRQMDHSPYSDCDRFGNKLTPEKIPEEWINQKQWLREIAESGLLPVEQSLRSLSLVLLAASRITVGPMLEFGYGVYSTPVLGMLLCTAFCIQTNNNNNNNNNIFKYPMYIDI